MWEEGIFVKENVSHAPDISQKVCDVRKYAIIWGEER